MKIVNTYINKSTFLVFQIVLLCWLSVSSLAQISVDPGNTLPLTADNIIDNVFLGEGVVIESVQFFGEADAVGVFENAQNIIGLDRGIVLTTGNVNDIPKISSAVANDDSSQDNLTDSDLEALLVNNISLVDVAKYEISFTPSADTIRFRYVFASEEYPEFVCSSTNDVFGFFISGPDPAGGMYQNKNIALIPDPADPSQNTFLDIPVSVNTVNAGVPGDQFEADPYCEAPLGTLDYSVYYNPVAPGNQPVYNAYLDIFEAKAAVIPCETYTIKIAIADGRLGDFDSAVFLEEKSFSSDQLLINVNNPGVDGGISEGCEPGSIEISLSGIAPFDYPVQLEVLTNLDPSNSAEENIDFVMIDTDVFIPKGQKTVTLELAPIQDNLDEETEYIYLQIRTDICNIDTVIIPLYDNSLNGIDLIDSVFSCSTVAAQINLDIPSDIEFGPEISFSNNNDVSTQIGDTLIESTINVSGIEKEMLEKNMIARVCIDTLIHQRLNDLDIFLQAPSGQLLELSTDNGARPDNELQPDTMINTCFTIFTGNAINYGNPIEGNLDFSNPNYSGLFLPEGSMDRWLFPFESTSNGDYTLVIFDDQNGTFTTQLKGWHIVFRPTYEIFYNWTPSSNVNCSVCPQILARSDTSEYYFVNLRDSYGCTKTDSVWLQTYPKPDTPNLTCDSTEVSSVFLSWDAVIEAESYEIRINERFPWMPLSSGTMPVYNGIKVIYTGNQVELNGFLPNEDVSVIIRAISDQGCASTQDTIVCTTLPCPHMMMLIDSISVQQPMCDSDGAVPIQVHVNNPDEIATYRVILPTVTAENNTGNFFMIPQGTWPVRVIDTLGCSVEDTVYIDDPLPIVINGEVTNISCHDFNDGTIQLTLTNHIGQTEFFWSNNATEPTIDDLSPGIYSVQVTDELGCTATSDFEITNPDPISYYVSFSDTLDCSASTPSRLSIQLEGGSPPFIVVWNDTETGLSILSDTPGYNLFQITDSRGCVINDSIFLPQKDALDINLISLDSLTCASDANGSAGIEITNGQPPYTVLWQSGENGTSANMLTEGIQTVLAMDTNGCTGALQFDMPAPPPLTVEAQYITPDCSSGSDGSITITPIGGTAPNDDYIVSWENGSALFQQNNLSAGLYCLTLTDENNCKLDTCLQLDAPEALSIQTNITSAGCNGGVDGSIAVTPQGGSGNYLYTWSGPQMFASSLQNISQLAAGTYNLILADATVPTCQDTFEIVLPDNSDLAVSIQTLETLACFGDSTGQLQAIVNGGNLPYSYSWLGPNTNSSVQVLSGLGQGEYSLTVTDSDACTASAVAILDNPDQLMILSESNPPACNSLMNGSIQVEAQGGSAPYVYEWPAHGSEGRTLDSITSGLYTLIVTDQNNCRDTFSIEVPESSEELIVDYLIEGIRCGNGSDASIDIIILQGIQPVNFVLNDSINASNPVFNGLNAGEYVIESIAANGCRIRDTLIIDDKPALVVDAGPDILVKFGLDAALSATVSNNTGSLNWNWTSTAINDFSCSACPDPIVTDITKSFSAKVEVEDSIRCRASDFINVTVFEDNKVFVPEGFSPNGDNINDLLKVYGNPDIYVESFAVYARTYNKVYQSENFFISEQSPGWDGVINNQQAPAGTYQWVVTFNSVSGNRITQSGHSTLFR